MTEPEIKVQIDTETQSKWRQWGTICFWRKEGGKMTVASENLMVSVGTAMALLTVALLLVPGSNEGGRRGSAIATPSDSAGPMQVLHIPSFNGATTNPTIASKRGGKSRTGSLVFAGSQVIARTGSGKIPPGTMARALFITGASNGPLKAEIREAVLINGEEVIEQGATLVGQGQSGADRLFISFTQMIHRSGEVETIQAQGCDPVDKIVGIKGAKVGRELSKLAAGAGLNFLGGLSVGLQEPQYQSNYGARRADLKNAALNGASTAALEQARNNISDYRSQKQIIEVPAQSDLYVLFNQ